MKASSVSIRTYVGSKVFFLDALKVFVGSLFLAAISLPKIPFYPTPMTLQTLGVFILGFVLGPRQGALAVFAYLLEASSGLPVLSGGHSNPLWMISPNGGFLLSFMPAAFLVGWIMDKMHKKNFVTAFMAVFASQLCIYTTGVCWLACFFGFSKAFMVGVVPFIGAALIKALTASALYPSYLQKWRNKLGA